MPNYRRDGWPGDYITGQFYLDGKYTEREIMMFKAGFEYHSVIDKVCLQDSFVLYMSEENIQRTKAVLNLLKVEYTLELFDADNVGAEYKLTVVWEDDGLFNSTSAEDFDSGSIVDLDEPNQDYYS